MENVKVVGQIDLAKFEKREKVQNADKLKALVIKKGSSPVLLKKDLKPELLGVDYPQEEINFFVDKNKRIVGRAQSGKIAIISFDYKGEWVKDCETWLCNIISEEDRKIIVSPVSLIKTSEENEIETVQKVKELKISGFEIPFFKPKNTRLYYTTAK